MIMFKTYVRPSSELRNKYLEISELVNDRNEVIITNKGKADMVMIRMDEYQAYQEYAHKRYIDEELAKAEKEAADPKTKWLTHEEVFGKFRKKYGYDISD